MRKTYCGSTPAKTGWTPSFNVPDPAEGWRTTYITDDPTLVIRGVRRTRDDNDHGRWKTYYLQMISKKHLKKMRVKLQRVIDKAQREEVKKFGRRMFF